jgi:hypothetical protein
MLDHEVPSSLMKASVEGEDVWDNEVYDASVATNLY